VLTGGFAGLRRAEVEKSSASQPDYEAGVRIVSFTCGPRTAVPGDARASSRSMTPEEVDAAESIPARPPTDTPGRRSSPSIGGMMEREEAAEAQFRA
jgi:hypothetical protein